jgi:hypothetical protein
MSHESKKTESDSSSKIKSISDSKSLEKDNCGDSIMNTDIGVKTHNLLEVHCALDIISIFIATLSLLVLYLGGIVALKLEKTAIEGGSLSLYVYTNSNVEDLVDLAMKQLPLLFPIRQVAEVILIPALIHNKFLDAAWF